MSLPTPHYLRVALDLPLRAGDAAFTYSYSSPAAPPRGAGVVVPFGKRLMPGLVLGEGAPRGDLRPVLAVAHREPLVPSAVLDLVEWTAAEYLSTVGEALSVALPWRALWAGAKLRCRCPASSDVGEPARSVLERLSRRPASIAGVGRLLAAVGDAMDEVARAGALELTLPTVDRPVPPDDHRHDVAGSPAEGPRPAGASGPPGAAGRLDAAVRDAMAGGPRAILLAGWHRTPAYLAAVRRACDAGWSTVAGFASVEAAERFAAAAAAAGLAPVLLHGNLSAPARLAVWQSAMGTQGMTIVGTRVAMFAPVADPVLAIVDDEDGSGHKEERAPRYLTNAVAAERTRRTGILIVGATTPTVTSYAAARSGAMRLVALPSPRPHLAVIDLRRRADPDQVLSRPVLDAVRRTVRRRGRAILLVDRKGYAGALHCAECGAVNRCPSCGVAMSYDRELRRLQCRVCGRTAGAPHACSRCGAARLAPVGAGTDRVATIARRVTAAVWKFDTDAIRQGLDPRAALAPFRDRGGVLVATSLVLPYLEDLHPDLVAVVAADRWFHRPEFRAAERALALLRTTGMAAGVAVLVETADRDHPAIRGAMAPSLRPFYADELSLREAFGYPPYRSLFAVSVSAASAAAAHEAAARLSRAAPPSVEVLGPLPQPGAPPGPRHRGEAVTTIHHEFIIKAADRAAAREFLRPLLVGIGLPRGVRISVDVDPHEL